MSKCISKQINNNLEVAHPDSGTSYTIPGQIEIWKCWFLRREQRAKKVLSDSPGLVDSVFNLPKGQVRFFEEFE